MTASSASASLLDLPLSQESATALFPRSSFLILNPPPAESDITLTLDASPYYTTTSKHKLQGFKLIPDGFHIYTLTSSTTEAIPLQAILSFTRGHQVHLRTISSSSGTFGAPDQPSSSSRIYCNPIHQPLQPETITSIDQLRTSDPFLIPYPHTTRSAWLKATSHLQDERAGPSIVTRVCGIDEWTADAHVDSFTEVEAVPSHLSSSSSSKLSAAEQRLEDQLRSGGSGSRATANTLHFTPFDLKRSWKVGTVGSELTRWSVDKSWLLADMVQRAGDLDHLLAEFELAFVLFHRLHSPACLTHWTSLLSLFSRSAHACSRAPAHFSAHPADPRSKDTSSSSPSSSIEKEINNTLPKNTHVQFLQALLAQLQLIVVVQSQTQQSDKDFFSSLHPTLETDLLRELAILRRSISSGLASRAATQRSAMRYGGGSAQPNAGEGAADEEEGIQSLLGAWRSLSHFSSRAFGWALDEELDEEAEVREDEEAEEGEDAPVVVDLDDDEYE
ncbi:hypothetical protein A4X09_0g5269 [Tilletia walkeri]|uniref:A1 cistron-splicing factor AAR2 n=1 Tax=Tilletia walkeri TaxID=117179 RepID=A0A8X7N4S8_9BASI|nr:hypothetical protein A4X09_0g5269 [Tilletia walkeri]